MESLGQMVDRISAEKNVEPRAMFIYLLDRFDVLQQSHGVRTHLQLNVFSDIATMMNLSFQKEPPSSLLETIDKFIGTQVSMDLHNAKVHADTNDEIAAGQLRRRAEIGTAVRLVLRECINRAEHKGLAMAVKAEEMLTKFYGGSVDGQKRLISSSKPGDEVKIKDPSDPEWLDIYKLSGDGKRCDFVRRERNNP
jgi:hypothetical protein